MNLNPTNAREPKHSKRTSRAAAPQPAPPVANQAILHCLHSSLQQHMQVATRAIDALDSHHHKKCNATLLQLMADMKESAKRVSALLYAPAAGSPPLTMYHLQQQNAALALSSERLRTMYHTALQSHHQSYNQLLPLVARLCKLHYDYFEAKPPMGEIRPKYTRQQTAALLSGYSYSHRQVTDAITHTMLQIADTLREMQIEQ